MMNFMDKNAASFTLHTCKQLSGDDIKLAIANVKIRYSLETPPKDHDPRPGYCHWGWG